MLKGTRNQINIVRVTSKLSHWDLCLKCDKQDNNLQEYPDIDTDLRLQYNEQENYLLECPDVGADMQEYTDLVDLRLKSNEQNNHLQEYVDVRADMQKYTEEGNDFEGNSEEYDETDVEESILPDLFTVQQESKVKIEINEELDSSDNLTQVKQEVLSNIDIDESANDTTDFCDINIRFKEELNESQQYDSTNSIFDEIDYSKEVDAIAKYFEKVDAHTVDVVHVDYIKVKNGLKTEKVDQVPKSTKHDAMISGTELSAVKYNACLKAYLGDVPCKELLKNHTTKDILPAKVIPSNGVVKVGNPISENSLMVKVVKIRHKRLAKAKTNENKSTKKYFTRSCVKIIDNSTSTQNDNYSTIRNDNNVQLDDRSTVKVESNKSVEINSDSSVAVDFDQIKVENDSKINVDDENDSSTVKENKESLLIEIPGKTKFVNLPKGKRKQSKEKTKRLFIHHNNVTYKVLCDDTNKKVSTQSKECRSESRTKQDINMRFACTQCDYKVKWKHHLDRHILLTHKGGKNFHCNLCDYICFRRCYLVRHMRAHSKNKTYSCNFCAYECVQKSQLNQHDMQRHAAGVNPFSRTKSKKYASRNSTKNIVYSNTIQNNNYSSVRNNNNVEDVSDNKFKVEDENESSTVKENIDLLIEIPEKTKVVKLPKGKGKLSKERTKRLYNHHNNVTYKVYGESCINKKFSTQSKECRSEQRTKQDINMRFACTQCDYKVNWKHHLDRHILLTHKGGKNFHCNLCDYKCIQNCNLAQHMRTHSKIKPYSCNFCNYNCVQRSQLDQHMRRHTGVKPFSCNICEYTCTQKGHLDQHMRRHTGIRPFLCIHCDYKFVQRSHLNQHIMKMHKNVQVYECSHCRYRCLKLDLLARHMNIH